LGSAVLCCAGSKLDKFCKLTTPGALANDRGKRSIDLQAVFNCARELDDSMQDYQNFINTIPADGDAHLPAKEQQQILLTKFSEDQKERLAKVSSCILGPLTHLAKDVQTKLKKATVSEQVDKIIAEKKNSPEQWGEPLLKLVRGQPGLDVRDAMLKFDDAWVVSTLSVGDYGGRGGLHDFFKEDEDFKEALIPIQEGRQVIQISALIQAMYNKGTPQHKAEAVGKALGKMKGFKCNKALLAKAQEMV